MVFSFNFYRQIFWVIVSITLIGCDSSDSLVAEEEDVPGLDSQNEALPPLPSQVGLEKGTLEHPIGALTAWTRCDFAGVFSKADGTHVKEKERNADIEFGRQRMAKAVAFFNRAWEVNYSYERSDDFGYRVDQTVSSPIPGTSLATRPEKGDFESAEEFGIRVAEFRDQFSSEYVYYILANHIIKGEGYLPPLSKEPRLVYDADGEYFYIQDLESFERSEKLATAWDDSTKDVERYEVYLEKKIGPNKFAFGPEGGITQNKAIDYAKGLKIPVPPDKVEELESDLVLIAAVKPNVPNAAEGAGLLLSSFEVRNICSGESLASINFETGAILDAGSN